MKLFNMFFKVAYIKKKSGNLQLVLATNFKSQAKFTTKISLFALNKLHTTLVPNNNEFWMKGKINEIHLHPMNSHIHIFVHN
jgi:hypothetical protein